MNGSPLAGKTVLVTRAKHQAQELSAQIQALGGTAVELPLLAFVKASEQTAVLQAVKRLAEYDWLILTSSNGVQFFIDAVKEYGELSTLSKLKIAVIGEKTERTLESYGFKASVIPNQYVAEELAETFIPYVKKSERVLVAKGNLARPVLVAELKKVGIAVDELITYETIVPTEIQEKLIALLAEKKLDFLTFTSPSTVNHLLDILKGTPFAEEIKQMKTAGIGPITEKALQKHTFTNYVVPNVTYTIEGMLQALVDSLKEDNTMDNLMFKRHRRLRKTASMRALVRETHLQPENFIYPLFVVEGNNQKNEVASMPGVYQISLDYLDAEIDEVVSLGIESVLLFGIPNHKDAEGSSAFDNEGIVQKAIRQVKRRHPELTVIADTCLCHYTDHGHCGIIKNNYVDNDESLVQLVKTAVSQAEAGADIIAPSNMMDGFVAAIRQGLDEAGFVYVPIMSYAVKYASSFYGPFRDAAHSAPTFGDRKTYQMDPANRLEALREAQSDIEEGADFLIVKPGLPYLDIVREVKDFTGYPVVAYNVSGEYSLIKAAAKNGWVDERAIVLEQLTSMKRAGADLIITYFAKDAARWLKD
ncbi:MAG TPA: porphobilinogen synthase [Bacilli bacterium]|nr:porphobilinogen synthase [Bacilli bacterium]